MVEHFVANEIVVSSSLITPSSLSGIRIMAYYVALPKLRREFDPLIPHQFFYFFSNPQHCSEFMVTLYVFFNVNSLTAFSTSLQA